MSKYLLFTHSKNILITIQIYDFFYPFIRNGKKKVICFEDENIWQGRMGVTVVKVK